MVNSFFGRQLAKANLNLASRLCFFFFFSGQEFPSFVFIIIVVLF